MALLLLMNIKENPEQYYKDFSTSSIKNDIANALSEYPYDGDDARLVKFTARENFNYHGHPILTRHIIFNLLKNAIYYIKSAGKGHIEIELHSNSDNNQIVFTDTGLGIAKDKLGKVFSRYYSEREEGTGLGLAFCKLIMESYGGDIECESLEGEYTRFILTFPKIQA